MLILIRGLPGSGKSTMARVKYPNHTHLEADMYFEDDKGNYNFDPKKLKEAHKWCLETTRSLLSIGKKVVVSNTFSQRWELEPYLELPYDHYIVTATGNYGSIHNVPEHSIQRMKDRWEII